MYLDIKIIENTKEFVSIYNTEIPIYGFEVLKV